MPVRAPGKVSAGQVSSIQWSFWDVLPTLSDLTHSATLSGIDGLSYSKALNGKKPGRQHEYFYWQFNEGGLQEAGKSTFQADAEIKDTGRKSSI